jgi:hypothetical protein
MLVFCDKADRSTMNLRIRFAHAVADFDHRQAVKALETHSVGRPEFEDIPAVVSDFSHAARMGTSKMSVIM